MRSELPWVQVAASSTLKALLQFVKSWSDPRLSPGQEADHYQRGVGKRKGRGKFEGEGKGKGKKRTLK